MARSVRSLLSSAETVERRIDSGVSLFSRSSTFAEASSAFSCACCTFFSERSMNFLSTSSIVPTLVF